MERCKLPSKSDRGCGRRQIQNMGCSYQVRIASRRRHAQAHDTLSIGALHVRRSRSALHPVERAPAPLHGARSKIVKIWSALHMWERAPATGARSMERSALRAPERWSAPNRGARSIHGAWSALQTMERALAPAHGARSTHWSALRFWSALHGVPTLPEIPRDSERFRPCRGLPCRTSGSKHTPQAGNLWERGATD